MSHKKETKEKHQSEAYTDLVGSQKRRIAVLRLTTIMLAIFSTGLLIALVIVASYPKSVPYVVELTPEGESRYVPDAIAVMDGWKPKESTERYFLSDFVTRLRTVSSDREVTRQNLLKVYSVITDGADRQVKEYIRETDPLSRGETETVQVTVFSISRISASTWQVDWRETTWTNHGTTLKSDERWRAILQTAFYTPRTESQMESNPIGLWVTGIETNKIKDV